MKLSKVKYLFIFLFLFSLMEKTGISVISLCSHIKIMVSGPQAEKQASENSESSEAKQVEVKEYWATYQEHAFRLLPVVTTAMLYPRETSQQHYNWSPPVPTPPPNFNV